MTLEEVMPGSGGPGAVPVAPASPVGVPQAESTTHTTKSPDATRTSTMLRRAVGMERLT